VIAGDKETALRGFFYGKNLDYLLLGRDLLFDYPSGTFVEGRHLDGYKYRVAKRGNSIELRFGDPDLESGRHWIFDRAPCAEPVDKEMKIPGL
jgi:hypothetical protein